MEQAGKGKSPYLLQHANNPVNWYPGRGGEEAKERNCPIFLECKLFATGALMERSRFEDEEVGKSIIISCP